MIGLIFDMDGVIVDNNDYHFQSWQQLAAEYDLNIDRAYYREKMNGRTLSELMRVVFKDKIDPQQARSIGLKKEAIYRDLYLPFRQPTPGLVALLEAAKEAGIPMVVGTSAPAENVTFTLDGLDLRKYFQGVVDEHMVTNGKPDPEVYLKCADMINIDPANCIVFEDALAGITAGQKAGASVVALATSHTREELSADLIIDDFTNIQLEDLQKLVHA